MARRSRYAYCLSSFEYVCGLLILWQEGEQPVKYVKSRARNKETEEVGLFGEWQTAPLVAPEAKDVRRMLRLSACSYFVSDV